MKFCKENEGPDLGKRELKTLITKGPKVTAADFAMKWKDHKEEDSPSTTHELTFDVKNGFDQDYVYVSGMTVNMIARVHEKIQRNKTYSDFLLRRGAKPCLIH